MAEIITIGAKYGRLTVTCDLGIVNYGSYKRHKVLAICDCGNKYEGVFAAIRQGRVNSCGCLKKEKMSTHSLSKHPLFQIWRGMKCRCYLKSDKAYPRYGGRGIFVCPEWKDDFKAFYEWAINNGWEKGLINDRRNNNKEYSPKNCRFVTPPISMRNTSRNRYIEFNGERKVLTDWALQIGIHVESLNKRLQKWPIEKSLTTPKTNQFKNKYDIGNQHHSNA